MAQGGAHDHAFDLGIGVGPVVLRVALLAAVPAVAGFALLRGFLPAPSRTTATWVVGTAGGVTVLELLLAGGLSLPVRVVPLILAMLAVALYAVRSTDPRFAGLRRVLRLVAPWLVGVTGVAALVMFARGWLAGDAVTLHTGVVLAMVALAWFVGCSPGRGFGRLAARATAVVVAVALIGGAAQAVVLRPREPVPGMAMAGRAAGLPVTIVPNLPGWNLVHVPAGAAAVGTAPDRLAATGPRPGTAGTWAAVRLPAGRAELWVRHGGELGSLVTNTGAGGTAPAELLGADGPECASALLGAMLGAGAPALPTCPAARLTDADAAALRETVTFVAAGGYRSLTLVADDSARGAAAAATVRAAADAAGLAVTSSPVPDAHGATGPVVIVAGWSAADAALRQPTGAGAVHLAPWLLTEPLLAAAGAPYVPQRFDPGDPLPRRYLAALRRSYPGEQPSAAGYRSWLAAQREPDRGTVHIRQVSAVPGWA